MESVVQHLAYKPREIEERTYAFACRVLRLIRAMPRDLGSQAIARQLARSGTSVGANVEEAQGAHSRRDFARRMNIARTEARESLYWLRLVADCEILPRKRLEALLTEADEIVRALVSIVKKTRRASAE